MEKYRASKLTLKENDFSDIDFLNENHHQGYIPSEVRLGLFDNDELICEMTFGRPRFNKRYDWELLRLCTKKDCIVYGGASRMFSYFLAGYNGSIISYCNESLFSGNIYNILGFTKRGTCNSYHYEKNGVKVLRYQMQKSSSKRKKGVKENIQKTIESFGGTYYPDLTEKENAERNGFVKINEIQATWSFGDKWYIYKITDIRNGKTYIGQHLDRNDDYWGSGTIIRRIVGKHGTDILRKEILEDNIKTQEEADEREIYYIKTLNPEYNIIKDRYMPHTHVSQCGPRPEEVKEKIKKTKAENPWAPTDEQKTKMSAHYVNPWNEETKKKLSETEKQQYLTGERKAYWQGKKLSEEHKRKIADGNKGHKTYNTTEGNKKISDTLKKKYVSGELTVWNKNPKKAEWYEKFKKDTGKSDPTFKRFWSKYKELDYEEALSEYQKIKKAAL